MREVNIVINGQSYAIACDEGQEEQLKMLGQMFERKVTALVAKLGQVGNARLHLIAGLLIADELMDAKHKITKLEAENSTKIAQISAQKTYADHVDAETVETILQVAQQIERVASNLEEA